MELRIGKARVAYSTIYEERRNEYEHTTIGIAMIALGVSVIATIVNLIVSFLRFRSFVGNDGCESRPLGRF